MAWMMEVAVVCGVCDIEDCVWSYLSDGLDDGLRRGSVTFDVWAHAVAFV